jgi:hypothetical protein
MTIHDNQIYGVANTFLQLMYRMRIKEMSRMHLLFRHNSDIYMKPLLEHHVKMGGVDAYSHNRYLKWDDASITVAYLDYVLRRLSKYKLNYGPLTQRKYPDYTDDLKKQEDALVEYFLYEMRKEPVEQKEIPLMPFN